MLGLGIGIISIRRRGKPPPVNTVAPLVSGDPDALGNVLSCSTGTWTGQAPITYSYQWKRAGVNIEGGTAQTYAIVLADSGALLICTVTATNVGGASAPAASNAVTVPGPPLDAPTIELVSASNDNTPDFDVGIPLSAMVLGYIFRLQADNGSGFVDYVEHDLDAGDLATGAISVTVTPLADGDYTYRARMEGGGSLSSWTTTTGSIDSSAPIITSSNTFSQAENSGFSQQLTADGAVTWTKTGGADAALFMLTGGGLLTIGAQDFELPADANTDNDYVVEVTATDAATNTDVMTITVTITDVADQVRREFQIGTFFMNSTGNSRQVQVGTYFVNEG